MAPGKPALLRLADRHLGTRRLQAGSPRSSRSSKPKPKPRPKPKPADDRRERERLAKEEAAARRERDERRVQAIRRRQQEEQRREELRRQQEQQQRQRSQRSQRQREEEQRRQEEDRRRQEEDRRQRRRRQRELSREREPVTPRALSPQSQKTKDQVEDLVHGSGLRRTASIGYARRDGSFNYSHGAPTQVTDRNIQRTIAGIKRRGKKFRDPEFDYQRHGQGAARILRQHGSKAAIWCRPEEWISQPSRSVRELLFGPRRSCSYDQVAQGALGDCWLLSSMATVAATHPELIAQRFVECNPQLGYYVLCFWKDGRWVEVLIDDLLLVLGGKWRKYTTTKLVYGHTIDPTDPENAGSSLWVPLIEKAYAKLHGGYSHLEGGNQAYGARDLTSGTPMIVKKNQKHRTSSAFQNLHQASGTFFAAWISSLADRGVLVMVGLSTHREGVGREQQAERGILADHEYSLIRWTRLG